LLLWCSIVSGSRRDRGSEMALIQITTSFTIL
jgi:hypothetical protein